MDNITINSRVLVLGLGGAGGRTVQTLSTLPESAGLMLAVFDTDRNALERLTALPEECRILCDNQWLLGQGTGGDPIKGQRALSRENSRLQAVMNQADLLIIVGGLGGGTATGGAGVAARLARSLSKPAILLMEMPFAFEGYGRSKCAEDGLRELLALSDTVLGIPNDLLFSVLPAETAFAEAFRMADMEFARTILGLIDVLQPGNLLSANTGDLASILRSRKSYAAIGVGSGAGETAAESCNQALNSLADSPFLGGAAKLKDADAVVINLTGGENLTLTDVTRTLEHAGAMTGMPAKTIIGANTRTGMENRVNLTAIAIKYDEREAAAMQISENARPAARKRKAAAKNSPQPVQQTLPLTIASCGIFEGKTGTVIDGVNFDIPSFVRNQIPIDTGE
ncbi:MAG: hypothetical protein E7039_09440 [Lentisphaerae bacterium]|nr:hypothetical protein [Lentisphaerota bacterium]